MVLAGIITTEFGIKAPAQKFFNAYASQLHDLHDVCERVHQGKLHEGDDWHVSDSVKHWTYVIDGKVHTCNETIEIDHENKKINYNLFGGDIDEHYKVLKLILEVSDKNDGNVSVKWSVVYEKIKEDVDNPNGYIDFLTKCSTDVDSHLGKA